MSEAPAWIHTALSVLDERKAEHLVAYDVRPLGSYTDWIILATATSDIHIRALARQLVEQLGEQGQHPRHASRRAEPSRWVALDYGDFVVHLLLAEARAHYHLEGLYRSCASISR